jgi:hypothetical protein
MLTEEQFFNKYNLTKEFTIKKLTESYYKFFDNNSVNINDLPLEYFEILLLKNYYLENHIFKQINETYFNKFIIYCLNKKDDTSLKYVGEFFKCFNYTIKTETLLLINQKNYFETYCLKHVLKNKYNHSFITLEVINHFVNVFEKTYVVSLIRDIEYNLIKDFSLFPKETIIYLSFWEELKVLNLSQYLEDDF